MTLVDFFLHLFIDIPFENENAKQTVRCGNELKKFINNTSKFKKKKMNGANTHIKLGQDKITMNRDTKM
jgi:hypothetical protein